MLGTTNETVHLEKRAVSWPDRFFAPYIYIPPYPYIDIVKLCQTYGIKHYSLAFIIADGNGNPSVSGAYGMDAKYLVSDINRLRSQCGGDVIVSFGGAAGADLARTNYDVATLVRKVQLVIDTYSARYIDWDVEGENVYDTAANDRRNQALVQIKKNNPGIYVSYTLAVTPNGLVDTGVSILQSAVRNGLALDLVNIMAMDYGGGVNGATGMGAAGITAATGTYKQVKNVGLTNTLIGITAMIGVNDVPGEVFRLQDARQVLDFAQKNLWVRMLSFWSVNRDLNNINGPLYASTQIQQQDYDFAKIFVPFEGNYQSTPTVSPTPSPTPVQALPTNTYNWPGRVFAPMVDTKTSPRLDLIATSGKVGIPRYWLTYIVAGSDGQPQWGGSVPLSTGLYRDQITSLRGFGGEVVISFGGPSGQELSLTSSSVSTLLTAYQNVIKAYQLLWIDFDIEGAALTSKASIDRRNQVIRLLQTAQPRLRVSYTLPATPQGLTNEGLYVLQSALLYGVRVDVVNILAMDYSSAAAPNGQTDMALYAQQAATFTYGQLNQIKLFTAKIGITVMIGQNNVRTQIFQTKDASTLVQWAKQQPWITLLSIWNVNRDNSKKSSDLTVSSNIAQTDFVFSSAFLQYEL
ncbi:glycoside hydrolase superfamily [Gorgonomyces haynaldii]|nr:glycoside hydrolase superfamily [Gorgonomyces haynaldii]